MLPILGQIGPVLIPAHYVAWSLAYLVGLVGMLWSAGREGLPVGKIANMMILLGLASILGSRVSAVLMLTTGEELSWFLRHPLEILKFWKGGMSFYGMVATTLAGGVWYGLRHDLPVARISDLWIPWVALGMVIQSAAGCFLAGCHPGTPTDLPWGTACFHPLFEGPRGVPLHPFALYLAVIAMIGYVGAWSWHQVRLKREPRLFFLVSWFFRPFFRFARWCHIDAELTLMAGVYYTFFRFFAEFTRGPETQIYYPGWPLSQSQMACIVIFLGCWGIYLGWREMAEALARRLPLASWMRLFLRLASGAEWLAKRIPYPVEKTAPHLMEVQIYSCIKRNQENLEPKK